MCSERRCGRAVRGSPAGTARPRAGGSGSCPGHWKTRIAGGALGVGPQPLVYMYLGVAAAASGGDRWSTSNPYLLRTCTHDGSIALQQLKPLRVRVLGTRAGTSRTRAGTGTCIASEKPGDPLPPVPAREATSTKIKMSSYSGCCQQRGSSLLWMGSSSLFAGWRRREQFVKSHCISS